MDYYTADGILIQRNSLTEQQSLVDLVTDASSKASKDSLVMIEVGSYQGESAEIFAKSGKVEEVWCIDPWKSGYDDNDLASRTDMKIVESAFNKRLAANPQMRKFKGTLDEFVKSEQFKSIQGRVDLVYIDACHTYEGCKNDIQNAIDFVKPSIAYSGHDFNSGWQGVKNAVVELLGNPDKVFNDTSWIKYA